MTGLDRSDKEQEEEEVQIFVKVGVARRQGPEDPEHREWKLTGTCT